MLKDEDLLAVSNTLPSSWHSFLKESGFASGSINKIEKTKLREAYIHQRKFEWVFFSSRLKLPEADSEKPLIKLGTSWKQLLENNGLEIADLKWGYSRNQFWLKIFTKIRYTTVEERLTFPLAQFTLVQPLKKPANKLADIKGILPEPPPTVILNPPEKKIPITLEPTRPSPVPKPSLPPAKPVPIPPVAKPKARVCIIIDDVGFVKAPADKMLEVPARLTWSFLPFSPYGRHYLEAASKKGFEVMLHLPLEPFNAAENPGPGTIKRSWDEMEIVQKLGEDLSFLPGVKGLNNHEGSAGTADTRLMEILMRELKKRNLFFIDSYTSNQSVAQQAAREFNVPYLRRQVFIDHFDSYDAKIKALHQVIQIALRYGQAVAIGHVRNGTPEAIMEMLPEFAKAGVEIVPVSELVK
jgi:polysaccharide deacetylase 2 family uncharacterized protein YibQ